MSKALMKTRAAAFPSPEYRPATPRFTKPQKYDIMISYSHHDRDLCFRIYNRLLEHKFRIWIDKENMHGLQTNAMADAIEASAFVIICMSDDYFNSEYCEQEAKYAKRCKRKLIPLIMTKDFHPSGWLGFLTVDLKYINFSKYEFDKAVGMLLDEIEMYRQWMIEKWFKAE
ncbi:unnamed protein product [Didymodactylos carnosus]|uniref:TIR domain-containing protein n=1 Tax=Didymodactylos carnosus TaxID=1234261 RepID=A0A816CTW5_9BILA|nr:unnamed protein product [Didymodactylos carnosus]CAF4524216.1 unnamed protein product [Didymodactylos carnosus]